MNGQKINYQKELEKIIQENLKKGMVPSLLLHSCCAPCSSYCLMYLAEFFQITLFYYNPNISPKQEYELRLNEQLEFIDAVNQLVKYPVRVWGGAYEPERFFEAAKGLETEREGGLRCTKCYELRLFEASLLAESIGVDYFTTTLTISPLKDAKRLNEIGERFSRELKTTYLPSDFKKKDGYKQSVRLSQEYHLYRQNYCGCIYSKAAAAKEKKEQGEFV